MLQAIPVRGNLAPASHGDRHEPDQGYQKIDLVITSTPSDLIPLAGDAFGILSSTPFITAAAQRGDRVWVCFNKPSFDPTQAIPFLVGDYISRRFNGLSFKLGGFSRAEDAPTENSSINVTVEVSRGLTLVRNSLSAINTQSVQGQTGTWATLVGDQDGLYVQAEPTNTATEASKTVTVDNTADQLIGANSARHGLLLVNNGGTDCYVGFDNTVTAGNVASATGGILLRANGGSIAFDKMANWTGAVFAITAAGNTVVGVIEW